MKKDMKKLRKALEAANCAVTMTKNGHWKIKPPKGEMMFISSTPSDPRTLKNAIAMIRRKGVAI